MSVLAAILLVIALTSNAIDYNEKYHSQNTTQVSQDKK